MAAPSGKQNPYREEHMTGWRLKVKKFATWSLLPLGYYLLFHYGELYNEDMPFENVLATPRRLHDDFFKWLLGRQNLEAPRKPEPMGLRAVLGAQEKREQAQRFLAERQNQALLNLVQRIEDKGLNRVRQEKGLPLPAPPTALLPKAQQQA